MTRAHRRLVTALLASLCVVLPLATASANHTSDTVNIVLADEQNRNVDVALRFSQRTFPAAAPEALLARDDVFADALASGVLQGAVEGPLLLTAGDDLDDAVLVELERLGAATVNILGGTAAVSPAVEQELRDQGYDVERFSGPTRVETAIAIAAAVPAAQTAVVARAYPGAEQTQAFADSLAAGGLAADSGFPVLLTETEQLTATTRDYLAAPTTLITDVIIVGGTAAVSERTASEIAALGISVRRVAGSNRFATAVAVAAERGYATSGDAHRTILVEGQGPDAWAAGFAAAAHADVFDAPIVLANGERLPSETRAFMVPVAAGASTQSDHQRGPALVCAAPVAACEAARAELGFGPAGTLTLDATEVPQGGELSGTFAGGGVAGATVEGCGLTPQPLDLAGDGTFAVTIPADARIGDCDVEFDFAFENFTQEESRTITVTQGRPLEQDFPVGPQEATVAFVSGEDPNQNRGARTYTVTADPGTVLRISLFPSANVAVGSGGAVRFADTDDDAQADGADSGTGQIEQVNGITQSDAAKAVEVMIPASASATVRIDSAEPGETVPVVFSDADADDQLDLDADDAASEAFGVGGETAWVPEEAAGGTVLTAEDVTQVNKDPGNALGNPFLVTEAGTYFLDDNDEFELRESVTLSCANTTRETFLANLSLGDDLFITSSYTRDRAETSRFCLDDAGPAGAGEPGLSEVGPTS